MYLMLVLLKLLLASKLDIPGKLCTNAREAILGTPFGSATATVAIAHAPVQ